MKNIWIDHLAFFSFFSILKLVNNNEIQIFYHRTSKRFLWFFLQFQNCFFRQIRAVKKIDFCLGDMKSDNGEILRYEVDDLSGELAFKITKLIQQNKLYNEFRTILPKNRLSLYFSKVIKEEIYTLIYTLCTVIWYSKNQNENENVILWSKSGLSILLKKIWPSETVPLFFYGNNFSLNKAQIKITLFTLWIQFLSNLYIFATFRKKKETTIKTPANLAVHYVEGIDLKQRNELFWYQGSNIKHNKILIYFDSSSAPVTQDVLDNIDTMGIKWVCLNRKAVKSKKVKVWRPCLGLGRFAYQYKIFTLLRRRQKDTSPELWTLYTFKKLIFHISYWFEFYTHFGIKIQMGVEESGGRNVVQSIVLDLTGGVFAGKQRSEYFKRNGDIIGFFPQHVFFGWNKRLLEYLVEPMNTVDNFIISGYCYDYIFRQNIEIGNHLRNKLNNKGVKFIVALFDNSFNKYTLYSANTIQTFYQTFIDWMLSDPEVGLIIKPKKIFLLEKYLPEILKNIMLAQEAGRCILYPNSYGRFPADVSCAADIAVGIGISSALLEAVIAGARGVLCDLTHLRSHLFYKLGYEKIVFDDINSLIENLKKFKIEPDKNIEFGNFSPWMDLLDPFRDGNAYRRIGSYLYNLLEILDNGEGRDKAIQYANKIYADTWGKDKVVKVL